MLQKFIRVLIPLCLLSISIIQFFMGIVFTSDIPVEMKSKEFYLFLTLSGSLVVTYILYIILNRAQRPSLKISLIFLLSSILWVILLSSIIRLESYTANVFYMGLVGLVISISLLISSVLKYLNYNKVNPLKK